MESLLGQLSSLDLNTGPKATKGNDHAISSNTERKDDVEQSQHLIEKRNILSFREEHLFGDSAGVNFQNDLINSLPDGKQY